MWRLAVLALAALLGLALSAGSPGSPAPALAAPANDNLANATPISTPVPSGIVASGTNAGATLQAGESSCKTVGASVWFTWTSPAAPGTIVFDTYGSDFDTVLAVYTGSEFPLTSAACNDDFYSLRSGLTLSYAANTTYRIQIAGYNAATGNFVLSASTGSLILVTSTGDSNTSDSSITLREAMLLATGGTGPTGLNRTPDASEASVILNLPAAGAGASDLIHFVIGLGAPATIMPSSSLPSMNTGGDVVSGIGAQVTLDGAAVNNCIAIESNGNAVEGLHLRGCAYGVAVVGNYNRVGGVLPGQRNFITGTTTAGILVGLWSSSASGNTIIGNVLGFRRNGSADLLSVNSVGIRVEAGGAANHIGGSNPGEGNVVSFSTVDGIQVAGDNNVVKGNKVGLDPTGSFVYVNVGHGISIGSTGDDNVIGGVAPGEANIIAGSGQFGVQLAGGIDLGFNLRNAIRGNSIHSNTAGGISTNGPGKPVINSVSANTVTGTSCGLCIVDIYSDTGNQGRLYVGTTTADSLGFFVATGIAHPLANVTATGTPTIGPLAGSTSDFSAPFAAPTNLDGDGVFDTSDACPSVPEDEDGFQDADGCPDPDNDMDGICDPGQTAVSCTGSDMGRYEWKSPLASPVDCRNVPEDFDGFHDNDGCPEPDNDYDTFPDFTDDCPGTDGTAGPDGIADTGDEPVFYLTPIQTREDFDGVIDNDGCHDSPGDDYDGDGLSDENEVFLWVTDPVAVDSDGDGVLDGADNCKLWPNPGQSLPPWPVPAFDSDCDGWGNAAEQFIGTAAASACGAGSWPPDFNNDTLVNVQDLLEIPPHLGKTASTPGWNARYDLNTNTLVNVEDILAVVTFLGKTCTP